MNLPRTSLEDRIQRAIRETIEIVPYDVSWPEQYESEATHLRALLAPYLERVEHFGSTAIPGMAAKPIVDMLVGVESSAVAKQQVAPRLERSGYEYFWRTDGPEPYAWFIRRDAGGKRTHHIHVIHDGSALWERLLFRDYLCQHPAVARRYQELKYELAARHTEDREGYTRGKTAFVAAITADARKFYGVTRDPDAADRDAHPHY